MTPSRCPVGLTATRVLAGLLCGALCAGLPAAAATVPELRVCADPDNLPASNDRLEGYDNRIVALIADELRTQVRYTWSPVRRGFMRRTLHAGVCDLVMGVPAASPGVVLTHPYYQASYALVSAVDGKTELDSLDAEGMRTARIGLHIVNVEGANPPPAVSLAARGLQDRVVGYLPWGHSGEVSPQARIVEAVAAGDVDVAVVWGPIAHYFARRFPGRLAIRPVLSDARRPDLPYVLPIAVALRGEDESLREAVEAALERRRQDVQAILSEYGVTPIEVPSR